LGGERKIKQDDLGITEHNPSHLNV